MVRNVTIDIAKVLSMIWVIFGWHFPHYVGCDPSLDGYGAMITCSVLACFSFLSGLFLGKKTDGVVTFYKKRFLRFYLLFFIACILFFLGGWINNSWQLLMTLTGISCFFPPQAKTIWYMAMIMIFYLLTPFITYNTDVKTKEGKLMVLLRGVLLFLCFFIINSFHAIESRFLINFFFYLLGIICPLSVIEHVFKYKIFYAMPMLIIFVLLHFVHSYNLSYLYSIAGVVLILIVSNVIHSISAHKIMKFLSVLSYASLSAYLFHRFVFKAFRCLFGNEHNEIPIYWIPLIAVVVFVTAYYIQFFYDKFLNRILNRETL